MQKYNKISIIFHWVIGLIIIGLLAVGLIMVDMPKPDKYVFYGWHKAIGIIVLCLVIARIFWRLRNKPPALPEAPALTLLAAKLTHFSLYFMMLFMPLAGWLMSSAGGYPVKVFGLIVPPLVEKNKAIGEFAHEAHEIGGKIFIALILLHIIGALYHQFILKDGLIQRMMPFCPKDSSPE